MAVLGVGGRVLLKRPCPTPCDLYGETITNIGTERCPEYVVDDGFYPRLQCLRHPAAPPGRSGDHISIEGLPIFSPSGQPYDPEGYAKLCRQQVLARPKPRPHYQTTRTSFIRLERNAMTTAAAVMTHTFYARKGTGDVPDGDRRRRLLGSY